MKHSKDVDAATSEARSENTATKPVEEFKLERLKFVLQQIDRLNQRLDKHIALYQTLIVAIITAMASIFIGWSKLKVPAEVARTAICWMLLLAAFVSAFVILLVVIGVLSWRDYRKDEVQLFDEVVGSGYRHAPNLTNIWRWHETYLVVFIGLVPVALLYFTVAHILPAMK